MSSVMSAERVPNGLLVRAASAHRPASGARLCLRSTVTMGLFRGMYRLFVDRRGDPEGFLSPSCMLKSPATMMLLRLRLRLASSTLSRCTAMVAVKWPKAPTSGGQYTHTIR